jgi:RimJ/RimL family protein N-acetyltransferase
MMWQEVQEWLKEILMKQTELLFRLPSLRSERVNLRPLCPDDYRTLFSWQSDLRNLHLWRTERDILSFEDFADDLRRRLRAFIQVLLMVEVTIDQHAVPVGIVYSYNTDLVDRYTYICVYLTPEFTAQGIGPEAGHLFAEYLFAYFGFRKIYSEIFAYNEPSLKAALRNGFVEEGCLKAHRWFGDRHWDLHILALTAEAFKELAAPVRDRSR